MIQKRPAVYILASERNGTLYAGLTSDLAKRVNQHKTGEVDGFTNKVWSEIAGMVQIF